MTTILVVCTGNTCRSPIAAALMQQRVAGALIASAGLVSDGQPAHPLAIESAVSYGIDLAGHRSRRLTVDAIEAADLVLGMERAHVREAVMLAPSAWPRAFTLKELVWRMKLASPRVPSTDLRIWLTAVHEGREMTMLLGASPSDDIADPVGQPLEVFEQTAAQLRRLIDELVAYVWPSMLEPNAPT
jgi:protein-tyrosine phosphatase